MSADCDFEVFGVAQPQGSKTAFVRNGRAVLTDGRRKESREAFAGWRASVATAARDWQAENRAPLFEGAVAVTVEFHLPRPKSASKKVAWPTKRPDLDKLTRAVLDALTGVVLTDDSQVVSLRVSKQFTADAPPRARVLVAPLEAALLAAQREAS